MHNGYQNIHLDKPLIVDCAICGADLYPAKSGREKRFCSAKCRKDAQRRREQSEKVVQEILAEQHFAQRCVTLPAQVAEKLETMKRIYGVYVALDALDVVITVQNVTYAPSRKGAK